MYLGFYLKQKGFGIVDELLKRCNPEGCNYVPIDENYAHEIDKKMQLALIKEYLPETYADLFVLKN